MAPSKLFDGGNRLRQDCCAREGRDIMNEGVEGYALYRHFHVPCNRPNARVPEFQYDHVNLRGKIGYGVSDGCAIDSYSQLRNDPNQLTRDRCRIQLFRRLFQGCPNLKPGVRDPAAELALQQGTPGSYWEGLNIPCKKTLTELQTQKPIPLVDCMKDVNDPSRVVPPFAWGGVDTRDYMRHMDVVGGCGAAK